MGSSTISKSGTAARSAGRAIQQRKDVELAEAKVESIEAVMVEMQDELEADIAALDEKYDSSAIELDDVEIKPYKKDISVKAVGILWIAE